MYYSGAIIPFCAMQYQKAEKKDPATTGTKVDLRHHRGVLRSGSGGSLKQDPSDSNEQKLSHTVPTVVDLVLFGTDCRERTSFFVPGAFWIRRSVMSKL